MKYPFKAEQPKEALALSAPATPLVSVVIPTYNGAAFLRETVDSALAQTYPNIEVIVVNDGSTDSTPDLLAGYGDRIRSVTQRNAGTSVARNTGIRESAGEYIAFLDHDDLWAPEKLSRQVPALVADARLGMVYGGIRFFNHYTGKVTSEHPGEPGLDVHDLLGRTVISLQCSVIPRSVFGRVGVFDQDLKGTDDWEICIRIANAYPIRGLPDILVDIRGHADQQGIRTGQMYRNSLSVLSKHRAMHPNCARCRAALKRAKTLIEQDYYQRQLKAAKAAFADRKPAAAAALLFDAVKHDPGAVTRIPKRMFERLTGRPIKSGPIG
jgi:glycosyltransferase involved in cell wall biosynthesis